MRPSAERVHRLVHAVRALLLVPALAADPTLNAQLARHGGRVAEALVSATRRHPTHEGVAQSACDALAGVATALPAAVGGEPRRVEAVVDAMRRCSGSADVQAAAASVFYALLRRRAPAAAHTPPPRSTSRPAAPAAAPTAAAAAAAVGMCAGVCVGAGAVSRLAKALKAFPQHEAARLGALRALRALLDVAVPPFGVPAAYGVPRVGGGVPEADTSLGRITDDDHGDGAASAVAAAVPWLRERAARAAARAAVPLLCRAVLLTQYGPSAQEALQLLAACARCDEPGLSAACDGALPAACQAATVAAVERVAARAICELVALLPAAALPPPAAAHALLRAAQTVQAGSTDATGVGLQLRYCAALRQLAWRHRMARQPAPPGAPAEALLVAALRIATAAAARGSRDDESQGAKPARRGGGGAAAAAAAMEEAAAAVQLQALALQAIAAWLEHAVPERQAAAAAEALAAAGLGRTIRASLESSYETADRHGSGAAAAARAAAGRPAGGGGGGGGGGGEGGVEGRVARDARGLLAASLELCALLFRLGGGGRDAVAGLANVRSAALAHVLQRPALQEHASLQAATVHCLSAQLSRGEARRAALLASGETVTSVLGALRRHGAHAALVTHACAAIAQVAPPLTPCA